jgi:hypothetical protein
MTTYATRTDFEGYVDGWVTTDADALDRLLQRAESDVDSLFPAGVLTNSLQGIVMNGVDDGDFSLSFEWYGDTYLTGGISCNADLGAVLIALNTAATVQGVRVPDGWRAPQVPRDGVAWARGPLPEIPVVVEASNHLGGQVIPTLIVDDSGLTGDDDLAVTIVSHRGGGTRLDVWQLTPAQRAKIRDATCAQAEYRYLMGEDFFRRAQWQSVSGPEFTTQGKLPLIGPKVKRELQGVGLLQTSARARLTRPSDVQLAYMPAGGTPIPDDWREP